MAEFDTCYHTPEAQRSLNAVNEAIMTGDYDFRRLRLEDHHKNTMRVFVHHLGKIDVIICSSIGSFSQFMNSVQKILDAERGVERALHACKVKWGFAENAFGYQTGETMVKENNFQAVLRMVQARSGQAVFYVG